MPASLRCLALVVAFLSTCTGAGAAQGDDVDALLAKHRAFVGWTAGDGSVRSWRLTERLERRGTDKQTHQQKTERRMTIEEVRRGLRYRDSYAVAAGARYDGSDGFTGRAFWEANENDYVVNLLEGRARSQFSLDALLSDAVSTLPGSAHRTAKLGDAQVDVIRVTPGAGYPIDLYEDSSGAYVRAVIDPDIPGARRSLAITSYVEAAPGKKIIAAYSDASGLVSIAKVELNAPVSDDDLAPPSPRATWTFGSTEPVPIDVLHGDGGSRQVNVSARVNGHAGKFLLDSGADGILIFGRFAALAGLKPIGSTQYVGVNGGTIDAEYADVADLAVGKNVLRNVIVTESNGPAGGVDGIFGYDFLAGAIVDVDLTNGEIAILDPAGFTPSVQKGAYAFPLDLSDRTPVIRMTLHGNVDARPTVDTGDDYYILLSQALSAGELIEDHVDVTGVDGTGEHSLPCARLQQVLLGPYRYENSPVCFGNASFFGANGGLVGFDFLRHFNWTFDYPESKLVLSPNGVN